MNDFPIPVVRRGYDPSVVERRLEELRGSAEQAQQRAAETEARLSELEQRQRQEAAAPAPAAPTFDSTPASGSARSSRSPEAEADEIRTACCQEEAASLVGDAAGRAQAVREEADRYAEDPRRGY